MTTADFNHILRTMVFKCTGPITIEEDDSFFAKLASEAAAENKLELAIRYLVIAIYAREHPLIARKPGVPSRKENLKERSIELQNGETDK